MAEVFLQAEILGLRDLRGRFARMLDFELQEIQMKAAEELGAAVEHIYMANAPRGKTDHFMESIGVLAEWTGHGFTIALATAEPELREWLRQGTGIYGPIGQRIYPTNSTVMVWEGDDGELVFAASTEGMRPNDWEVYASMEAAPLVLISGNKIGREVVDRLAGVP